MNFSIVWNFLHTRGTQRRLSVKLLKRANIAQKPLKLGKGQPVPISPIFYFKIVGRAYEKRNRGDLLTGSECRKFFFYFFFTSLPTIFGGEFFKFYCQNETIIASKMVSSKFLYMKNVHQNPIMKVWTNIVFSEAPNLPSRLSSTT